MDGHLTLSLPFGRHYYDDIGKVFFIFLQHAVATSCPGSGFSQSFLRATKLSKEEFGVSLTLFSTLFLEGNCNLKIVRGSEAVKS